MKEKLMFHAIIQDLFCRREITMANLLMSITMTSFSASWSSFHYSCCGAGGRIGSNTIVAT
jgi:hypothetical protein